MTRTPLESLTWLFDTTNTDAAFEADPLFAAEVSARFVERGEGRAFEDGAAIIALCEAIAAREEHVPTDLVDGEIRRWKDAATAVVSPFSPRERSQAPVLSDSFMQLAAASETGNRAMLCRSQSGIWTLEIFVSPGNADRGYLLLSVHPDHRVSYEGRAARVFVKLEDRERVLAEEVVRKGEIYTPISLEGLDLHARDAINVTFD